MCRVETNAERVATEAYALPFVAVPDHLGLVAVRFLPCPYRSVLRRTLDCLAFVAHFPSPSFLITA